MKFNTDAQVVDARSPTTKAVRTGEDPDEERMKNIKATITQNRKRLPTALLVLPALAAHVGDVQAYSVDTGISDLSVDVSADFRYLTGVRVEKRDEAIGNDTFFDSADYAADRGEFVTNRIDVYSGADIRYSFSKGLVEDAGFRASFAAFKDFAYEKGDKVPSRPGTVPVGVPAGLLPAPLGNSAVGLPPLNGVQAVSYSEVTEYSSGQYNGATRRQDIERIELRDLFAFANLSIADMPLSLRGGQYGLFWGEAIFTPLLGVAYSMGPIDLGKSLTTPGAGAQDVFLPVPQISATLGVTDSISLGAQYFLDWEGLRAPEGGTYLNPIDPLVNGPDRLFAGNVPGIGPYFLTHEPTVKGNNKNNFGLQLKWAPTALNGGTLAAYYRKFDEVIPGLGISLANPTNQPGLIGSAGQILEPINNLIGALVGAGLPLPSSLATLPGGYRLVYPKDTELYGLTASTKAAGISLGAELVYNKNRGLNSSNFGVITDDGGARGDVFTAVLNGIYLGGAVNPFGLKLADSWAGILEFNGSYLDRVTERPELYKEKGTAACRLDVVAFGAGGDVSGNGGTVDSCSSDYHLGLSVAISPVWYQVLPSTDLSATLFYSNTLKNNSPIQNGGNEGFASGSLSFTATYAANASVTLAYNYYDSKFRTGTNLAGEKVVTTFNGLGTLADRDWVSLAFKYSF